MAGGAAAQDDAADLDEVVVTGTLIRGIAPVGAPVVALGADDIQASGHLDVTSVLKTVPQISYLGISESTTGTTANGNGTNTTAGTGVNIRGLGQQATLTLINGHRGAPGGQFGNYFEPSNVPAIALGGIEILTDGASAIYGSDAMAGVVNLILRRNYDGAEVRAAYTSADGYDGYDLSAVVGKTWEGGGVMIAAQRYYHSELWASDRPRLFISDGPKVHTGNGAPPRGYLNFTPAANIRTGAGTAASPFVFYAVPYGATSFAQATPNAQNIMGQWYGSTALPEQERTAFIGTIEHKFHDRVRAYGQAFHSERDWVYVGGVSGATPGVNSQLNIPAANPFFLTGVPGVTTSQTVLVSQYQNLGPLTFDGREKSWQWVAGLDVELWADWRLDANWTRNANRVKRTRFNTVNTCGIQGGAGCIVQPGEVAGGMIAQTSRDLAFNPYGSNLAYPLNRIRATDIQEGFYDSDIATVKIDGPVFELPGGMIRAALGYEHRKDEQGQHNTTQSTAVINTQVVDIATSKPMTVESVFGEVVVPLIGEGNAQPWAKRLEVALAVRHSDYDILSKATTDPKFGVTWEPADGLSFSGSYSTSFRVNLASTDRFNAPLLRIRSITDYLSPSGTANAIQRGGGNPDLEPESSKTWTLGVEYQPPGVPGLEFSLTYFNVNYKGVIDTPGAAILNSITANSEAIYGAFLTRRPSSVTPGASDAAFNAIVTQLTTDALFTGAVLNPVNVIIDARSQNAGVIDTTGLDFRVSYSWETGFGDFDAAVMGEYFLTYKRSLTPTGALTDRLDLIDFPQEYRLRGQLGWKGKSGFSANLFANYTPSYTNTYPTPVERVDDYLTLDAGLSYDTEERPSMKALQNIAVSVNVQNLFDKRPPLVNVFNQNFDSSITSMLQRVVTVQLTKRF